MRASQHMSGVTTPRLLRNGCQLPSRGDAFAQFNLAILYDKGYGVPHDYAEAVKWFRLAVEQRHASAQYNLSLMYDNGRGVPQDYLYGFGTEIA